MIEYDIKKFKHNVMNYNDQMNNFWYSMVGIFGFFLLIIIVCNCNDCIKEYRRIQELSRPTRRNQVYPIPVTRGIRVESITEDLEVITVL